MKRFILTTALVLGAAAPALAQTQLEMQLGVPAGAYTLAQQVAMKGASDLSGNDARLFFSGKTDGVVMSTSNGANRIATKIFADLAKEKDSNTRYFADHTVVTTYSGGAVNATAQRIFQELDAENPGI